MSEPSRDIGSVLKKERENKGISLDMVHEATKIPIDSLKAIEEGYKVRTLTPFYYKSFVRIYAQYLGMDPDSLVGRSTSAIPVKKSEPVQAAPARVAPAAAKPAPRVSQPLKTPKPISLRLTTRPLNYSGLGKILKIAGMVLAAVILLSLVSLVVRKIGSAFPKAPVKTVSKEEKRAVKKEKSLPVTTSEVVRKTEEKKKSAESTRPLEAAVKNTEPARVAETAKSGTVVKKAELPKKIEPAKTTEAKVAEAKPVAAESKPAEAVEPAPPSNEKEKSISAASLPRKVAVSVRAVNNAWLNVHADGSPVFQGILKKGTSDSWSASKVIDISGKDINQLEFEVNGKPVGRLSRRGVPAKKIRITPEGLTVEK